jgi:hypothetical protein
MGRAWRIALVLGGGLMLASCSSFSGFVADNWPRWAGGMPADVPPRPGAPGYEEFIARQQGHREAPQPAGVPPADASAQTPPPQAAPLPPPPETPSGLY